MKSFYKINEMGDIFWYKEGTDILHREDGPAVEFVNGSKQWFINGKLHRENGPAEEWHFREYWWKNGKLHREDGPAITIFNYLDRKIVNKIHYFINDKEYAKEQWEIEVNLSPEEKFIRNLIE